MSVLENQLFTFCDATAADVKDHDVTTNEKNRVREPQLCDWRRNEQLDQALGPEILKTSPGLSRFQDFGLT